MADIHNLPQDDETLASFPAAPDELTGLRWAEARRRRRMLEGLWRDDLEDVMREHIGPGRRRRQGPPDMSKNVFRTIVSGLSVLYDRPPLISHDSEPAVATMESALSTSGTWPLSMRLQQLVVGQRESARVFAILPDGTPQVRNVPADLLHAVASADSPDEPHTLYEYRPRAHGKRRLWTRDCWSVEDPDRPFFEIQDEDGNNISGLFGVEPGYPAHLIGPDGPVIPGAMFHASRTGRLYDPWTGIEVVEGSLIVALLWTMWGHVMKDSSWPQRYTINLHVPGVQSANAMAGEITVDADPAMVLPLVQDAPNLPFQVGQWSAGGDPEALGRAIQDYSADLAADLDLGPGDIQRSHDSRSGYAIEITREGQRNAQRRSVPNFSRADTQFLSRMAVALGLPSDGWGIEYAGVPLSLEERRVMVEEFKAHSELGITSPVVLVAKLQGITMDAARRFLEEASRDRFSFSPPS